MQVPLYLAADHMTVRRCTSLLRRVGSQLEGVKIHHLWDEAKARDLVLRLKDAGASRVWIDTKVHETVDTVRVRAEAVLKSGADSMSVHVVSGIPAMQAAVATGVEIIAITLLSSLTEQQVRRYYNRTPKNFIRIVARDAVRAGVRIIQCPPTFVETLNDLRSTWQPMRRCELIVPGTRSVGVTVHDQVQVLTPREAVAWGANKLVIGREITQSRDPAAALERIEQALSR